MQTSIYTSGGLTCGNIQTTIFTSTVYIDQWSYISYIQTSGLTSVYVDQYIDTSYIDQWTYIGICRPVDLHRLYIDQWTFISNMQTSIFTSTVYRPVDLYRLYIDQWTYIGYIYRPVDLHGLYIQTSGLISVYIDHQIYTSSIQTSGLTSVIYKPVDLHQAYTDQWTYMDHIQATGFTPTIQISGLISVYVDQYIYIRWTYMR